MICISTSSINKLRCLKLLALIAVFLSLNINVRGQYTIYNSWNFENEEPGQYTDAEIRQDFNYTKLYSHNSASIVTDTINHKATKVLKVTHPANKTSDGFEMNVNLEHDYNEVYLSYNIKFSKEFNSTKGGKLPGLGGLPDFGTYCPTNGDGFRAHNIFKRAGTIVSYHYDRTPHGSSSCPWGESDYDYNPIFFNNGTWYNITQRLVLNTFSNGTANQDGIKELWVDGRLIFQLKNLIFMEQETENMKIDAFRLSNFYGGSDKASEPVNECYGFFDNFKVYLPVDDSISGQKLHHPATILPTPDEITNRTVYYDSLITSAGNLSNTEYGGQYGLCKDETYLIDAGEGNTVKFTWDHSLTWGDYLFFYDGNKTDSKLLRAVKEVSNQTGQEISSTGRYLFIRFSTDTEDISTGWTGTISLLNTTGIQDIETGEGPSNVIKVLPNPGTNQLTIKGIKDKAELSVFDMLGRKVIEKKSINNNERIDIRELQKGIYTIKLSENNYHAIKFIKQ